LIKFGTLTEKESKSTVHKRDYIWLANVRSYSTTVEILKM